MCLSMLFALTPGQVRASGAPGSGRVARVHGRWTAVEVVGAAAVVLGVVDGAVVQPALGVSAVNQPERRRYAGCGGPGLVIPAGWGWAEVFGFFGLFGLRLDLGFGFGSRFGLFGLALGFFLLPALTVGFAICLRRSIRSVEPCASNLAAVSLDNRLVLLGVDRVLPLVEPSVHELSIASSAAEKSGT